MKVISLTTSLTGTSGIEIVGPKLAAASIEHLMHPLRGAQFSEQ